MEPITPINITGQTGKPNMIWKSIITVKAGGKGRGVISTAIAPKNTSKYCHHI